MTPKPAIPDHRDEPPTVAYQFEIDEREWVAWKRTLPHDDDIHWRLRNLIVEDTGRLAPAFDGEKVLKELYVDAELWNDWADTIPRSHSVDDRLRSIIRQDYRAATRDDDADQIEGKMLAVYATRIRMRAMHAADAIRNDDPGDALEKLDELVDMANTLEQ